MKISEKIPEKVYDTIVIGLGAIGSAALYQLSMCEGGSQKLLGIDRFAPPHNLGSSHGDTRITRQAIGEGTHFTPLSLRSYEIFKDLEKRTGRVMLRTIGGLMISGDNGHGVHGVADFFKNTEAAARAYDIKHETFDAPQIRRRFPQFKVGDNQRAYYEYEAGYLLINECISAQLNLARDNGAEIHTNETVKAIEKSPQGATVITNLGKYCARCVVITAGPWLPEFFGDLAHHFEVERQVQYWFDVQPAYKSFSEDFPIFIWETPIGGHIYGFPAIDGPTGGFKLGSSRYNRIADPNTIERNVSVEEIALMYKEQVGSLFYGTTDKCIRTAVCMYTTTRDAGFVIDWSPTNPAVLICSACSGHGFKHSAAIGEAVAQLITNGETRLDISAFELGRL